MEFICTDNCLSLGKLYSRREVMPDVVDMDAAVRMTFEAAAILLPYKVFLIEDSTEKSVICRHGLLLSVCVRA